MTKYFSSPDNGSFWRQYLDKSYSEGKMNKEMYDAHLKIHEESIRDNEKFMREDSSPNLERDLRSSQEIQDKCTNSETYCRDLYSALCNNRFFYGDKEWTCSWRYAGGIVSDIIEKGDYIQFYCGGNEGQVTDEIRLDLIKLGWIVKPYPEESNE